VGADSNAPAAGDGTGRHDNQEVTARIAQGSLFSLPPDPCNPYALRNGAPVSLPHIRRAPPASAPDTAPMFATRVERLFRAWIATPDGLGVAREVARRALAAKRSGQRRGSCQAIVESLRWDPSFRAEGTDGFKVNNSHVAPLAAWIVARVPELQMFFERRRRRGRL